MSNGLKLMVLAASTIITCMVVTMAMHMARVSQETDRIYCKRLENIRSELSQSELTMYDGITVYGADVVNFIKKQFDGVTQEETTGFTITVVTKKNPYTCYTYQNNVYLEAIQNFTDAKYIPPNHLFLGNVIYNDNDVIVNIVFTVQ